MRPLSKEQLKALDLYNIPSNSVLLSDSTAKELGIVTGACELSCSEFSQVFSEKNSSSVFNFLRRNRVLDEQVSCSVSDPNLHADVNLSWGEFMSSFMYRKLNVEIKRSQVQPISNQNTDNTSVISLLNYGQLTVLYNGKILSANKLAQELFPDFNLKGLYVNELVYPEYQADIIQGIENLRTGQTQEVVGIVESKGTTNWLEVSAVTHQGLGNKYIIVILKNISKLKRQEKLLQRKIRMLEQFQEEAKAKIEHLESISFSMSHDLRNPVASLRFALDILQEEPAELIENGAEWLQNMSESTQMLTLQLNSYLTLLSEIKKTGLITGQETNFNVETVIKNVLGIFKSRLAQDKIHVSINVSDIPEVVYNERLFTSIVENLLSNAIKYRDYDKASNFVELGFTLENAPMFYCKDNGIGMDLEKVGHKLFKPNAKFTEREDSTGIGLYMINKQVQLNGGEIKVSSQPGVGTEFKVYLKSPLKK